MTTRFTGSSPGPGSTAQTSADSTEAASIVTYRRRSQLSEIVAAAIRKAEAIARLEIALAQPCPISSGVVRRQA